MSKLNPLVSIVVVTYQHKNYIKQCLDSLLNQKTNFNYEIIVGDDESTDGTRDICIEYAEKYSDKIRLFLRSRKDVIYHNGKPTGRFNFFSNLNSAKGEFITMCEGDDYWSDPNKLQKQVDFLNKNEDYVATTCNTFYLKNNELSHTYIESKELWLNDKIKNNIIYYSNIPQRLFPHTSTWMFRNNIIKFSNFDFSLFPVGDMAIFMILCNKGKVHYSDETMTVYRIHDSGAISTLRKTPIIDLLYDFSKMYIYLDKLLNRNNNKELEEFILNDYIRTIKESKSLLLTYKGIKKLKETFNEINLNYSFAISVKIYYLFFRTNSLNLLKNIKRKVFS